MFCRLVCFIFFLRSIGSVEISDNTIGPFVNSNATAGLSYVTEYRGRCTENAQCEWLGEKAVCDFQCVCAKEYRWYQGKCIKYQGLNGNCKDTLDCYDGYNSKALTCNKGKCVCATDYYQRGNIDCRHISDGVGVRCALDIDCQFTNGQKGECLLGKCVTSAGTRPDAPKPPPIDKEKPKVIEPKSCKQNVKVCEGIANSECYDKTGTCICKRGYFFNENGNGCIPEIGMSCRSNTDCPISSSKCEAGTCQCDDLYFVDDANRNCVKSITEKNPNCLSNEWCYAWGPLVYCSSDSTCHCSKISDFDKSQSTCVRNSKPIPDDMCRSDFNCKKIRNSLCIDEQCQCGHNYRLENQSCLPNLGADCNDKDMKCTMKNAICSANNKICECTKDYVGDGNVCYPHKSKLGESCDITKQCNATMPHTQCNGGNCKCLDNYLTKDNYCIERKKYGDYCENRRDCTLSLDDTFVCRNSKCQCATNSKYDKERNQCSTGYRTTLNVILITMVFLLNTVSS